MRTAPSVKHWSEADMIPIYKHGNPENPISYKPIALFSPAREAIEGGIPKILGQEYKFMETQSGFQKNCERSRPSSDTMQTVAAWSSLLYLIWNPRTTQYSGNLVMERVIQSVTTNLVVVIWMTLQLMPQKTQDDKTGTTLTCEKEMSQTGPLSLPLLSLCMDTFASELGKWKWAPIRLRLVQVTVGHAVFCKRRKVVSDNIPASTETARYSNELGNLQRQEMETRKLYSDTNIWKCGEVWI